MVSWLELTDYVRCVGAPVVHGENSDGRAPMGNEQSEHCLIGWRVRLYGAKLVLHRPHTGPCPEPRPADPVVLRTGPRIIADCPPLHIKCADGSRSPANQAAGQALLCELYNVAQLGELGRYTCSPTHWFSLIYLTSILVSLAKF